MKTGSQWKGQRGDDVAKGGKTEGVKNVRKLKQDEAGVPKTGAGRVLGRPGLGEKKIGGGWGTNRQQDKINQHSSWNSIREGEGHGRKDQKNKGYGGPGGIARAPVQKNGR